jgi:hypothetical protein
MKFTPGVVVRYKMISDMDMTMTMSGKGSAPGAIPPMHEHMESDIDQTVQSVDAADGSATILEHITHMTGTMNGQPIPGMDALTNAYKGGLTIKMGPDGRMLSIQVPPSAAGSMPAGMDLSKLGGLSVTTLPPGPVRVGDTWKGDADLSAVLAQMPGAPGLKMTVLSSLMGLDSGARTVASIGQTYSGAIDTSTPAGDAGDLHMVGKLDGISTMKFDVAGGTIDSQDGTMTMGMTMTPPAPKASPASTTPPQVMKMRMRMTTHLARVGTDTPGA